MQASSRRYLADALQYIQNTVKESNIKHWKRKLQVTKMTGAFSKWTMASTALPKLVCSSLKFDTREEIARTVITKGTITTIRTMIQSGSYHSRIEQSIGHRFHVMPVDPVVPDLHLRGLAYLVAREHAEPDALSEATNQSKQRTNSVHDRCATTTNTRKRKAGTQASILTSSGCRRPQWRAPSCTAAFPPAGPSPGTAPLDAVARTGVASDRGFAVGEWAGRVSVTVTIGNRDEHFGASLTGDGAAAAGGYFPASRSSRGREGAGRDARQLGRRRRGTLDRFSLSASGELIGEIVNWLSIFISG